MILQNFAVIEGCDGSGTTTQLHLLEKQLCARIKPEKGQISGFHITNEPTRGPIGRIIRSILMGEVSVQKETLARLFAADRGEHLYAPDGIIARCSRNELVVSDRYTPSSLVYQGLECGRKLPETLNGSFPNPEILIYLDVDPNTAMDRICRRNKKAELYDQEIFQAKVRDAYLELLPKYQSEGVTVSVLDGTLPPGELSGEIWRILEKMPIMDIIRADIE